MPELSPFERDTHVAVKSGPSLVARAFWVIALIGAILGAAIGFVGVSAAGGAPQEAAAAAMGCFVAIVPYVFARAVDELTRR